MADFYLNIEYKHKENREMHLLNGSVIKIDTILFFALSYKYKDKLTKKEWTYANVIYIIITATIFIVMLLILLL